MSVGIQMQSVAVLNQFFKDEFPQADFSIESLGKQMATINNCLVVIFNSSKHRSSQK